jgi:diguanylate cyclase (GGDEF)-like protein
MPDLKTLAGRLFKLVFGWYLLLAILVTSVQLGLEYSAIRTTISSDLAALGRSFAAGVSDALWTYDQPLLDSLVRGIAQTAIVTGVRIENSRGETVATEGHVPGANEPVSGTLLAPFQMHEVPLWSIAFGNGHDKRALGKMVLYSDRGVAVDRVRYSFVVILINSLIKTAGLWLIFYWAITWRLSRPLTELSNAVSSLDLKADEDEPVLITYPHRDEIGMLVESLNDMRIRLSASHRELEQKVAERTHELEAVNHVLAALSTTDGLTGIANRRRFDDALANEWKRALRSRQPLALLMLDVDLFKNYNDHYGHQAGDDVLRKVARVLEDSSRRSSDLAARYGGEEFVVIAADTDAASALRLGEAIRQAIEALGLTHAKSPLGRLTVSIGVSVIVPGDSQQPEILIQMADGALYLAKSQGRNCVMLRQENAAA